MAEEQKTPNKEFLFQEYKLAVETQMHFNDLLMKLRSLGLTAVVVIFSYAITKVESQQTVIWGTIGQSQVIIACGIVLLICIAALDLLYFYPLLLGAVDRSSELDKMISTGLTKSISKKVPRRRATSLLYIFYIAILVVGVVLLMSTAPKEESGKKTRKSVMCPHGRDIHMTDLRALESGEP